ncbi:MAG: GIY-YIG nuclease family protein, partial [Proteobacteria bacterium]|nr:GIY-YIG nuclease family protein [Pseudomonadota bacterium]
PKKKKSSHKGALLKGMSRKLPIELLDDPSFKKGLQEIMRDYAGVYALYNGDDLYYVGLATNLYWRLLGHTKNKHRDKWDNFAIFRINRVRYLKDIETLLLRVAAPRGNVVSGHLHRDADLTRVLQRIQRDQMRKLKKIKKALR